MSIEFGQWIPLETAHLDDMPDQAGAIQVRQASGLVKYPRGKSAMVFYAFADTNIRTSLMAKFDDRLVDPPVDDHHRHRALWVRFCLDADARVGIEKLYLEFIQRFGAPPGEADEPA